MQRPNTPQSDHAPDPRWEKIYDELRELLDAASPTELRRSLEDLFFNFLIECDDPAIPDQGALVERVYCLIHFFNTVEETLNAPKV